MADTSAEDSKAVVRRSLEALNDRDRATFIDCFSPDAKPFGLDLDKFVEAEFAWFDAFPDLEYTINELFGEGELVAVRWTFHGTHEAKGGPDPIQTIEPTHEEVEVTGINVMRIEDGQILEFKGEWSVHELLDTIGLITLSS